MRSPFSPHPLQHLLLSIFLIIAILVGMKCYYIVVLLCISLMTNDVEHLFTCLLSMCLYTFFDKVSIQIFCSILKIKLYFKIIGDSYIVVKNNTEKSHLTLYSVSLNDNIFHNYSTLSQPWNWHWYNPHILLRFPVIHVLICVCVFSSIQFYHRCRFV